MKQSLKKAPKKGEKEYFSYKRRIEIFKTIILFAVALSLYFGGYAMTGTNKNLLTFAAVLGLLPASKVLISAIMYIRYKGVSDELFNRVDPIVKNFSHAYGLVFTSYDKNYICPVAISVDGEVLGLLTGDVDNNTVKACEEHVNTRLSADRLFAKVKMFKDEDIFYKRIDSLDKDHVISGEESSVTEVLMQISL